MKEVLVLAYSGGLDTSVAIKWIQEKYGFDVVTLTLDLGQGSDFKLIEEKALRLGALRHYSIDAKEEFANEYIARAIKANALYEGKYPLSTALSRPLISKKLVEVAWKEGAIGVAHGSTGKGNDQVRFEVTVRALDPSLKIIAPIREWGLSREEELEYARRHGIPLSEELGKTFSVDKNLWGRSVEGGPLEDPSAEPPEAAFEWTRPPERAPDSPAYLEMAFEGGLPVGLNGVRKGLVDLISELNALAGLHGVGRIDHLEDRLVGIKSREVYECPAAMAILEAHLDLEKAVLTRHELEIKQMIDSAWSRLVYYGLWVDPLREDLEGFIDRTQERVSGIVKMKLYKGSASVVGRSSPFSLYDLSLATYGLEAKFDQRLSEGFVEIWGLASKVANSVMRKASRTGA
ncbi:MAG: argininosuccinate synthase [Candidatus Bathyarchaeia archaeon]